MCSHTLTPALPRLDSYTRLRLALDNRAVALVLCDSDERRSEFLRESCARLSVAGEHAPALVRTPEANTDAALLRVICSSLGVAATRTRSPMWREIKAHAEARYRAGARLLLAVDDLHQATDAQLGVLHLLTTVTAGHDLAIGVVLAGRAGLEARLMAERHAALRSRVGAVVRLDEDDPARCERRRAEHGTTVACSRRGSGSEE